MKKIVIAGSSSLLNKVEYWKEYFENCGYDVLDYPRKIEKKDLIEIYSKRHKEFFENIVATDILFVMNEDKNDIEGYIGVETFAELAYGLALRLVHNKKIELIILKTPSKEVSCYEEINLWLELGWIKLYNGEYFN